MKILLSTPYIPPEHKLNIVAPLGIGYVAAALIANHSNVQFLDPSRDGLSREEFRRGILEINPDVIGFTVYSCDVPAVRDDSAWIKDHAPDTIIVAGGPHPSAVGASLFDDIPNLDFGIAGEGEKSFPRLIDAIESNIPANGIPGIISRTSGACICNPPEMLSDLDEIPFPAWDLLKPLSYPESPQGIFFKRLPITQIITTRGCPFPCTFCSGRNIHGLKIRKRSISLVLDEVELLTAKYGIREIHILDDNFTHGKLFASEFCDGLLNRKIDIAWCCPNGIRLDTLDAELLALMKRSGCYSISAGIESGSQKILDSMKKGLTKETIMEKVRLIKKAGLTANGFFIIGFPGETAATASETIAFSKALPLDRASFFNYLPLPGTPSSAATDAEDGRKSDYSQLYYTHTPFVPSGMTADQLKRFQRKAFMSFFLRPRIIFSLLLSIRTPRQVGFILTRMVSYLK